MSTSTPSSFSTLFSIVISSSTFIFVNDTTSPDSLATSVTDVFAQSPTPSAFPINGTSNPGCEYYARSQVITVATARRSALTSAGSLVGEGVQLWRSLHELWTSGLLCGGGCDHRDEGQLPILCSTSRVRKLRSSFSRLSYFALLSFSHNFINVQKLHVNHHIGSNRSAAAEKRFLVALQHHT